MIFNPISISTSIFGSCSLHLLFIQNVQQMQSFNIESDLSLEQHFKLHTIGIIDVVVNIYPIPFSLSTKGNCLNQHRSVPWQRLYVKIKLLEESKIVWGLDPRCKIAGKRLWNLDSRLPKMESVWKSRTCATCPRLSASANVAQYFAMMPSREPLRPKCNKKNERTKQHSNPHHGWHAFSAFLSIAIFAHVVQTMDM